MTYEVTVTDEERAKIHAAVDALAGKVENMRPEENKNPNTLVGALATLLGFFLQDGLTSAGAGNALLGPLLLLVALGGVAGSRAALLLERLPYRLTGLLCLAGVAAGAALSLTGRLPLLAAGGLLASACDDAFQMPGSMP